MWKRYLHSLDHCSIIYIAKIWKQPKSPSTDEWINKIENMLHTHMEYSSSVVQSCPTLCDSMDCSMPDLPVHHQILEVTQTHVHWVGDAIQPSQPVTPFSSCLKSFPGSRSFQMNPLLASHGQSIWVSASASVLPMSIQDWFPLGWSGFISLQSKGLSKVFSNTTVQKNQCFTFQLSL